MSSNSIEIPPLNHKSSQGKTPSPLDLNTPPPSLDLNAPPPSFSTTEHFNEYGSYDPVHVCATLQSIPDEQAKKKWSGYSLMETAEEHNERMKQLRCDYDAEDDIIFDEQLDELLQDDLDIEINELFDAIQMKDLEEEVTEMFEDEAQAIEYEYE